MTVNLKLECIHVGRHNALALFLPPSATPLSTSPSFSLASLSGLQRLLPGCPHRVSVLHKWNRPWFSVLINSTHHRHPSIHASLLHGECCSCCIYKYHRYITTTGWLLSLNPPLTAHHMLWMQSAALNLPPPIINAIAATRGSVLQSLYTAICTYYYIIPLLLHLERLWRRSRSWSSKP